MPSINMIAVRGTERKRLEKQIRTTAVVIVGEVAIALFILGFMTTRVFSASQKINELDLKLMTLQPTVTKISDYEGQIKKLEPRLNLLSDSRNQTLLWYNVLQDMARSMPQNTWLNNMTTSVGVVDTSGDAAAKKAGPRTTISVRGQSGSQALVGETMLRMNQFAEFEKVELSYTKEEQNKNNGTIGFEISAKLKPVATTKTGGTKNGI